MRTARFQLAVLAAVASIAVPITVQGADDASGVTRYVAHLHPMNSKVAGHEASGEARFTVDKGELAIRIDMKGVAPGLEHWQHFHGFKDDRHATCPTTAADVNHDGVIDLVETGTTSGTTMVPFNADPASMEIVTETYPKASANGAYSYRQTVSLKTLTAAFAKAFGTPNLDLDHRVVIIHGVAQAPPLPGTVASLGPIPAYVTLPIACGVIERVGK